MSGKPQQDATDDRIEQKPAETTAEPERERQTPEEDTTPAINAPENLDGEPLPVEKVESDLESKEEALTVPGSEDAEARPDDQGTPVVAEPEDDSAESVSDDPPDEQLIPIEDEEPGLEDEDDEPSGPADEDLVPIDDGTELPFDEDADLDNDDSDDDDDDELTITADNASNAGSSNATAISADDDELSFGDIGNPASEGVLLQGEADESENEIDIDGSDGQTVISGNANDDNEFMAFDPNEGENDSGSLHFGEADEDPGNVIGAGMEDDSPIVNPNDETTVEGTVITTEDEEQPAESEDAAPADADKPATDDGEINAPIDFSPPPERRREPEPEEDEKAAEEAEARERGELDLSGGRESDSIFDAIDVFTGSDDDDDLFATKDDDGRDDSDDDADDLDDIF